MASTGTVALLRALLVYMTLLASVHSLPLSIDGSAQVSCFASDLSAPTYDLTTAIYQFCSESFPTNRIVELTTASEDIKLESGKIACLTTALDPIVSDWTSGDCTYLLLKTVSDCEVDGGVSTGGEYNPIETGASQFMVKVVDSSNPARSAADATLTDFDADNSMIARSAGTDIVDVLTCYSFEPAVLSNDLVVFIYSFCAINEPPDSTLPIDFDATKDYKFSSGNTARFSMHLDPALSGWKPSDCVFFMLRIVQFCGTADGYNTGGEYQADGHDSKWSIAIHVPLGEDASSTEIAAKGSLAARQTSAEAYCFGHSMDDGDLALPITWAMQAVVDFCEKFDGEILNQNFLRQYTIWQIQPNVWIAVRALRSNTLWDAGCRRAFDIILNACHSEDWYFFGGHHQDEFNIYTMGVQDPSPAIMVAKAGDQNPTVDILSAQTTTEGTLVARSDDDCYQDGEFSAPLLWAVGAVQGFCQMYDGVIMEEGHIHQYVFDSVVPHVRVSVRALRSNTLWDEGCRRVYETILNPCHSKDGTWEFYGGQHMDVFNLYSIGIDPPATNGSAKGTDGNSALASRSPDKEMAESFNATESTNAKFTTSCSNFPWSENPISIDYSTAQAAVDWLCPSHSNGALGKGKQVPLTFLNTDPKLFANFYAMESAVLSPYNCDWAYDSLFKACVWDGRFYGGEAVVDAVKWVLDFGPISLTEKIVDAGVARDTTPTKLAPRDDAQSLDAMNVQYSTACNNFPWIEDSMSIDSETATKAAKYFCSSIGNKPLAEGDQAPLMFQGTDPNLFTNVIAMGTVVLYPGDCDLAYDTLFKACTWNGRFYGGEIVAEPVKWVLEFPPAASSKKIIASGINGPILAPSAITPRDRDDRIEPFEHWVENKCYNVIGRTTKKEWAGAAATELCNSVGTKDFHEGDWNQYTLLNDVVTQPIRARVEAYLDAGVTVDFCRQKFIELLEFCSLIDTFFGGVITNEGFSWSIVVLDEPDLESESKINVGINGTNPNPVKPHAAKQYKREFAASADCDNNDVTADAIATYQRARDFCDGIGTTTWQSGDGTTHLYEAISPWISARAVALDTVNINPVLCYIAFQTLINSCTTDFRYGGGKIDADGVRWTFTVVPGSPPADAKNADIATRSDPYHDGSIDCVTDSETSVFWPNAFSACITFCRGMDGAILTPGSPWRDLYELKQSGGIWVTNNFEATDKQVTMDYQTCIEMYDATIRKCNSGQQTLGGTNEWNGLKAEYKVEDWSNSALSRRGSSDSICVRTESTPIDKQAAGEAVSLFCPEFSGQTIGSGDFVTKTILVDGFNISMRVSALSDNGYMLYPQRCYAGFEQLFTECSDGAEDDDTVGGTLFAGNAAFTLSMVFM